LRIIQSAKEIGWTRASDLSAIAEPRPCTATDLAEPKRKLPKPSQTPTIKCLIEIDKALHLSSILDENLNKHVPPNSYVTFSYEEEEEEEEKEARTSPRDHQSSPAWNYQLCVNIDSDHFVKMDKPFVFKVWHRSATSDKLMGQASVDLKPLTCGLSCISGWYNIEDVLGNSLGQIKLSIVPQESLAPLKRLIRPVENVSTLSKFNFTTGESEASSSQLSQKDFSYASSTSDLKLGLQKKLSELDQLNRHLRDRLEKKTVPICSESKETQVETQEIQIQTPILNADKNADSFWVDPSAVNALLTDLNLDENLHLLQSSNKNENNNDNDDNLELQNDNGNDTDLDQTFNLNASYEVIISSRKEDEKEVDLNGNFEASYEIVNKIIDCGQLNDSDVDCHEDDEEIVENVAQNEATNFVVMETTTITTTIIAQDASSSSSSSSSSSLHCQSYNDDENLTVIVPEELNKIAAPETEEVIRSEEQRV
jgi:hypothetical protein